MSDRKLLEIAERVASAKDELELAESGLKYYQRVTAAAEVRVQEKREAFNAAMADMRTKGGY